MRFSRAVVFFLLAFAAATGAFAHMAGVPATPSAPPLTRANTGTWAWSNPAAWSPAGVPGDGAVVDIPSNSIVTLAGSSARIKWIQVEGTLALSSTASSTLYVETLFVDGTGNFNLTPALPVLDSAQVIFTTSGPIDTTWDPTQLSRGLVAEGRVTILGAAKTPFAQVVTDVPHNTATLTLDVAPTGWRTGDSVVLTGSYFRRNAPMQDERRTILNVNGKVITVNSPFTYDHLHVSASMNLHLANLTRNVVFSSDSPASKGDRGHVMLENRYTDVEQAAFVNLGRTDKSIPLDDVIFKLTPSPHVEKPTGAVNNHRGRYALHVHETEKNMDGGYTPWVTPPATPPTVVKGCVVDGTLDWGFVNHSSYVNFQDDVAYNFTGSGFVTEGGDELGNFTNDIAIHGVGDGKYRKVRLNFGNAQRPQPIADFAFSGHGFWFAGPALRVSHVVANSCNGDGVLWHTAGTVDVTNTADAFVPNQTGFPNGRYHFFPRGWISTVYAGFPGYVAANFHPRQWTADPGDFDHIIIADLPILQCDNVDSYANLIGLRPRFSNHDSFDWYDEVPAGATTSFGYDGQIIPVNGTDKRSVPSRLTQTLNSLRLWNNEEVAGIRYVDKTTWNNVTGINRLDYDEPTPANNPGINPIYAIEMYFNAFNQTFNSLTLDGYEMGPWTSDGNTTATGGIPSPAYSNYTAAGTWSANCPPPGAPVASTHSSSTATVTWAAPLPTTPPSPPPTAYLLRYRAVGDQQWHFGPQIPRTTRSVSLSGLAPGKTYQLQADSGCSTGLSLWVTGANFTMPPCAPHSIATQPSSQGVFYGTAATLSVGVSGDGPFSYEWYLGSSSTTTIQVSGNDSSTYTTPALTGTSYCWVRVTSACSGASVDSDMAEIGVYENIAVSDVQAASGTAWSQPSITVNWPQPTSAGDLLVAVISASDVAAIGNFTPPAGWLLARDYAWNNIKTAIYYLPNGGSGRTSETFGVEHYPDLTLQLAEYAGMATASPLDQTAFDGDNAPRGGTAASGTTAGTAQPKELVITALTTYAQTTFSNATSSFTELSDLNAGWNLTTATYELFTSTTGSYATAANVGGSAQWVGLAATFRAANPN